jgi:hypothetical protein
MELKMELNAAPEQDETRWLHLLDDTDDEPDSPLDTELDDISRGGK